MAILFDETDDFYTTTNADVRAFPASNWCMGMWVRVDDNTGSNYQYLISTGGVGSTNTLNFFLYETSEGAFPDSWRARIVGATGGEATLASSSTPGGDGVDRLIIIQRNETSSQFEMWFCEPGGTASLEATADSTGKGALASAQDFFFGRRNDSNADRYYGGVSSELFKGNFVLTQAEIEYLARGASPLTLGHTLTHYWPLRDARVSQDNLIDGSVPLTATTGQLGATEPHIWMRAVSRAQGYQPPSASSAAAEVPTGELLSVTSTSSIDLTTGNIGAWDDSEGTAIYDNGTSKVGVAWSPDGYAVALDGAIVSRWYTYASWKWDGTSIVFPTLTTPGTTYYIATNGDDGNSGTVYTSPKQSLDSIGSLSAGDTVLLRAGDTWIAGTHFTGDFEPPGSGTSSNRIKFGAYNGADGVEYTDWIENKPTIDCNGTVTYGMRLGSGGANDYFWVNNIEFREGDGVGGLGCITSLANSNNLFFSHCRVIANGYAGMHLVGVPHTIFHCEFTDNGSIGVKFYQDVSDATGNLYAYNTFSNNGSNGGSTGAELDGVVRLDEALGNIFGERGNDNHCLYREHNQTEEVGHIGKARIHHNVFDQRTTSTPAALQCLPLKGVGGRAYCNTFLGPMKGAIGALQASYRGTPRLGEAYISCNVIAGVDGTFGSDDDFRGAITLDRIDGALTGGPTDPRNYYRAWAYNNTLYDCMHGINIQPNYWFDTTAESQTGLSVKNNLMSDIQGYVLRAMEGGGVHRKPGYFWEHDFNYYWNVPTNAFYVNGEGARNSNVTADAMPFSEWTAGITDWQDSEANPLLDFDANTSMEDASPAFTDTANIDFSLGTSSPARSENFSGYTTEALNQHPLFGDDAALFIGINNVPMAGTPDMGAYQSLHGKVLDLTDGFVLLSGTATSFVLEAEADTEANLITRTA